MDNALMEKEISIVETIASFVEIVENEEFIDLCLKAFYDLRNINPKNFTRGKTEIWAAGIVWAVGRANFLSDLSFEPYADLDDMEMFFEVKKSTIGNKASTIKKMLDINYFNDRYLLEEVSDSNPLNNFFINENGLIVPKDLFDDDLDDDDFDDEDYFDGVDGFESYMIEGTGKNLKDRSVLLQYNYYINKMLEKWQKSDNEERDLSIETIPIDGTKNLKLRIIVTCYNSEALEIIDWLISKGIEIL